LIRSAIAHGDVTPGCSTVVESSSGNLAIGLAQICRYYDLRCIVVVDAKTTKQNLALLTAFGAEIEVVDRPDPVTGEYLPARLRRVQEIVAATPHSYWPNQYANPLNPQAHHQTMFEIAEALGNRVDYLFCATSTCGTLRGCVEYIRKAGLSTTVVAVDAMGSAIFVNPPSDVRRLLPGHGAAIRPALYDHALVDHVVHVTDLECVVACRRLVQREAMLVGGSSGAVLAAIDLWRDSIPDGANCVAILPDGGERYLDTIFNDEWARNHFGEITYLWKG
jgi:cysteine synthase A